jgi:eukaryotic-like serine/threonine-protein kinase
VSLAVGARLGPYEIVAPLGAGGMGEVYRARDTRLKREVAVKVLPSDVSSDPKALARFESEARAVAALSHPNILAIFDVGDANGTRYAVTELLDGQTLRAALARGPLGVRRILEIAEPVAQALAAAHENGIIHRDIKPENIFLTRDGHVKVLDFGLARHGPPPSGNETGSPTVEKLTGPGVVIGTVVYMSPEQARGGIVDHRTDQFSLGIVLYEMLAGQRPFVRDSAAETLTAIIREEPEPLERAAPGTPAPIRFLVERLLTKEPEGRYDSTHDLARDLTTWKLHPSGTSGEAISAAEVDAGKASRLRRRVPAWALGAAAALAVAFGLLLGTRFRKAVPPNPSPVRLSLSFPPDAALLSTVNTNPLALSPDGKTLVYVYAINRLFVRSLDCEEIKPIPGTEGAVSPFFSPDGLWVGFFSEGQLKKVPLAGGPPIALCAIKETRGGKTAAGSWGADGTIVFNPTFFSGLQRISASGGASRPLTTVDATRFESHDFPQILPDGEHVLFQYSKGSPEATVEATVKAAVISLRTGKMRVVAEDAAYPRYLPTGHLVFTRRGSLLAAPFSLKRLEMAGLAVPMLDDLVTNRRYTNCASMAFSSEGTLVYRPRQQFQRVFVWMDRKGAVEPLPFPPGDYIDAVLSPDGGRVAAIAIEKAETTALLLGDLARGTLTRSPVEGNFVPGLAWTPDSRRLALGFTRNFAYPEKVYLLNADGSTAPELATIDTENLEEHPSSVSPDGSVLLFTAISNTASPGEGGSDIYVLPLSGERKPRPFLETKSDEAYARFSPDGRWVSYLSNESGRWQVFVRPFPGPGPKWQISTEARAAARWSHDGRELFYRQGDKLMAVDVETKPMFRAGRPRVLFEDLQLLAFYGPDPRGQRFLMVKREPAELVPAHANVVLNWFDEVKRRVPGAK